MSGDPYRIPSSPNKHGSHPMEDMQENVDLFQPIPIACLPTSSTSSLSQLGNRSSHSLTSCEPTDVVKEGRTVITRFLQNCMCYELIKNSSKVVVFDVKIPINLAFFALVEHEIKSAPLWSSDEGRFVGMLTATDIVNILRHFYIRGAPMSELADHSIASWRDLPSTSSLSPRLREMISISPEESLYAACKRLADHRLHRLPILDPSHSSVLGIVTHGGILEFLVTSFREQRRLFDQRVRDLGIGTFENIITVPYDMPLIQVLHTLVERRISAVPIVDSSGAVVNIYCIADVTLLARDRTLSHLDLPIGEFLNMQSSERMHGELLQYCAPDDTLHMIFEKFAAVNAHRLVAIDEQNRCIGIVSLSDLFNYFIELS